MKNIFVFGLSIWLGLPGWGTAEMMLQVRPQAVQGWWTFKINKPNSFDALKIRVTLPKDLPNSSHLHVVIFEELIGGWGSPSGVIWEPRGTVVIDPSEIGQIKASPAPYRTGLGDYSSMTAAHGALTHGSVMEWSPGSRTAWLDIKSLVPNLTQGISALRIAMACYHQPAQGGEDRAFHLYPCDGESLQHLVSRSEGDYSNDPLPQYAAWRFERYGKWTNWFQGGDWPTSQAKQVGGSWLAGILGYSDSVNAKEAARVKRLALWMKSFGDRIQGLATGTGESGLLAYRRYANNASLKPFWDILESNTGMSIYHIFSQMDSAGAAYDASNWVSNYVSWIKAYRQSKLFEVFAKEIGIEQAAAFEADNNLWFIAPMEPCPSGWFDSIDGDTPLSIAQAYNGKLLGYFMQIIVDQSPEKAVKINRLGASMNFVLQPTGPSSTLSSTLAVAGGGGGSGAPGSPTEVSVPLFWAHMLPIEWDILSAFSTTRIYTALLDYWAHMPQPHPFEDAWWAWYRDLPWAKRSVTPATKWDAAFLTSSYQFGLSPYFNPVRHDDQPEMVIPTAEYPIGRIEVWGKKKP